METKELKIQIPEGYEIDKEKSTFEKIVFKEIEKPEPKTYEEVAKLLLNGKTGYFTSADGNVVNISTVSRSYSLSNTAPTKEQLEWVLALNKLQNVANYLNDGWKPDWSDEDTKKYYLWYNHRFNKIQTDYVNRQSMGDIHFKSRELAHKACEILGEENVKKALGVYKGY